MTDLEQDAKAWTKEKLLQTSGDRDFLTEKVHKWHNFHFLWTLHEKGHCTILTPSINEKILMGRTFDEWLDILYTPLEATILSSDVTSWEFIGPLLNGDKYHNDEISFAISSVTMKMPLPKGEHGTYIDITEASDIFGHDVTLLDIINILDREVALLLYKDDM